MLCFLVINYYSCNYFYLFIYYIYILYDIYSGYNIRVHNINFNYTASCTLNIVLMYTKNESMSILML